MNLIFHLILCFMHLEFKKSCNKKLLSLAFHILVQEENSFILLLILIFFWIWEAITFFFLVTREACTIMVCYFYNLWAKRIFISVVF